MKKNFFKKLSFVMASAMLVSAFAPAAGVGAATSPALNATKKYLHLSGISGKSEYDFNVNNKQTGWKYAWTTANENVAEVDNVGLATATGVGSTKVSVKITKSGKTVKTLSATVVVRDNIETVKVSNAPETELKVNEAKDLNRTFVTEAGSTTKTSSITRWAVDKATATIDNSGVFKATEAGEYKVTAMAFQSTEKFEAWKVSKDANLVLASDEVTIKVAPSLTDTDQLTFTTAKLVFDTDMSKTLTKDNLKAYRVIAGVSQNVDLLVKEIKFDATGKEATVTMYVDFVGGETYKFVYGTLEGTFVAAKAEADQVESIVLETKEAVYTEGPKTLTVKLFNKDGVDITTSNLTARVTYSLENNVGYLLGDKLTMFVKGDIASIKATYHTYKYDASYNEIVVTATGSVTAVDAATYGLSTAIDVTLATGTPDWSKAKVSTLAAGDTGYKVYARVKSTKTTADEYFNSISDTKFTFDSSNKDVLIVDTYGTVYPAKAGAAVIICYYDNKAIATFPVVVTDARAAAEFSLDKQTVTLSNSPAVDDTATVKLSLKDQLGANFFDNTNFNSSKIEIVALKSNPDNGVGFGPVALSNGNKEITVTGEGKTKGVWTYQVKAYDKVAILVVTIQEPTISTATHDSDDDYKADVSYYRLTLDKTSVDRAVAKDSAIKTVTPTLMGYASNGVAVYKATWTDGFSYEVTKGSADAALTGFDLEDGTIEVVAASGNPVASPTSVGGPAITAVTGAGVVALDNNATYLVTAYEGTAVKGSASFVVTDSKVAPTYVLENSEVTPADDYLLTAVRDAFKVSLSGTEVADAKLYTVTYVVNGVEYTDTTNNVKVVGNVFVKSVKFVETFTADSVTYGVEYTVNIGRTIVVK